LVTSSKIEASIKSREPAVQTCPELGKIAFAAPGIALSRSASASTIVGDLPPSSSVTRFIWRAEACMMRWPVAVEPVKAILRTSGCSISGWPTSGP
jgi:hypothetical protein